MVGSPRVQNTEPFLPGQKGNVALIAREHAGCPEAGFLRARRSGRLCRQLAKSAQPASAGTRSVVSKLTSNTPTTTSLSAIGLYEQLKYDSSTAPARQPGQSTSTAETGLRSAAGFPWARPEREERGSSRSRIKATAAIGESCGNSIFSR